MDACDLLIRGGLVVDGTGSPGFRADVAVGGGEIRAVGPAASRAEAEHILHADGLAVCPGFVDMHTHSDISLLVDGRSLPKTMQGVTTEVIGHDGLSFAPVDDATLAEIREQIAGWNGPAPDVDWSWRSVAEYLRAFDGRTSPNVAFLAPHGTIRLLVMGQEDRRATPGELDRMRAFVRRALEEGAFGLSTGLTYTPASYADTDELVALCAELVPFGGFYAPHTRSYGRDAMAAYDESIEIAARSGAALHLTHCQLSFPGNEGRAGELLDRIAEATDAGVEVTMDSYPYEAGSTTMHGLLPSWAKEGGTEATLERLADGETRRRIRHELEVDGSDGLHGTPVDWGALQIASVGSDRNRHLVGRRVDEAARAAGEEPFELVRRVLLEERLNLVVLTFVGHEANVRELMRYPGHMGGSDGIMVGEKPHPRAWGTFARYLGHYTRDLDLFTLEEMVRKLASLPCRVLRLWDRGLVRPGFRADLVAFDPRRVRDTATYDDPRRHPEGIHHVLVNGELVVEDGSHTGALPGRSLRPLA